MTIVRTTAIIEYRTSELEMSQDSLLVITAWWNVVLNLELLDNTCHELHETYSCAAAVVVVTLFTQPQWYVYDGRNVKRNRKFSNRTE